MEERELVRRWLPDDLPVLEFGAGLGVVSCLANRKLSKPNRHIVVEANPAMIPLLTRNRDINKCSFSIVNKAIGYGCDTIDLNIDSEFVGSTSKNAFLGKTIAVPTTTIQRLLDDAGFSEAGIICDIEGTEADIVEQEFSLLRERISYVLAELHPAILGHSIVANLMKRLEAAGFRLKQQIGDSVFLARN
jgi:FkbM family methyltransferase